MRSSIYPELRRRLERFGDDKRGGKDGGFVCSRRSLIRDADRKFHAVCVPAHLHAKEEPAIELFLDLPDFDVCHHHSPFRIARTLRSRASLRAVSKRSCEARAFSTLGFLIVEIDFASIGAVLGTIVIDSGPARSAPLEVAITRTAQTAAADKADRKRTPFLLCMGLSLAWPIAMALSFAPARIRRMSLGRSYLDSRGIETQASEITQFKHRRRRSFGRTLRTRLTSEGIGAARPSGPSHSRVSTFRASTRTVS